MQPGIIVYEDMMVNLCKVMVNELIVRRKILSKDLYLKTAAGVKIYIIS